MAQYPENRESIGSRGFLLAGATGVSPGTEKCPGYTLYFPEGPSTQYFGTLVPNTIPSMVFGTIVLKYWVLGPSGFTLEYWFMILGTLEVQAHRTAILVT